MCVWMDGSDLNSDLVNITLWRELGRVASDRSVSDHVSACCNASAYAVEVKSPQLLPVGATLQVSVTGSAHASAVECTGKRNLWKCVGLGLAALAPAPGMCKLDVLAGADIILEKRRDTAVLCRAPATGNLCACWRDT